MVILDSDVPPAPRPHMFIFLRIGQLLSGAWHGELSYRQIFQNYDFSRQHQNQILALLRRLKLIKTFKKHDDSIYIWMLPETPPKDYKQIKIYPADNAKEMFEVIRGLQK